MGKIIDLIGQRFSKLTVVAFNGIHNHKALWLCRCDCGNEIVASTGVLRSNHRTSCGCLMKKHTWSKKHGFTKFNERCPRIYTIWQCMKSRCNNSNNKRYARYGGRGVKVCEEWKNDFQSFYDWAVSSGYKESLTIERINVNGDYCPSNCTWITNEQQQQNTTRSVKYLGICEAEWERKLGCKRGVIKGYRHHHKCSLEEAINHFTER